MSQLQKTFRDFDGYFFQVNSQLDSIVDLIFDDTRRESAWYFRVLSCSISFTFYNINVFFVLMHLKKTAEEKSISKCVLEMSCHRSSKGLCTVTFRQIGHPCYNIICLIIPLENDLYCSTVWIEVSRLNLFRPKIVTIGWSEQCLDLTRKESPWNGMVTNEMVD